MADDVALSLAQRTTLISLQQIDRDSAIAQRRLSFGRRIVDVTDDPAQFFQARGLSLRAEAFLQRRSQIDQGVSNLQAQLNGLTGLRNFLNQAIGIIDQAQASNTDADQLANLTVLFDETIEQLAQLARDTRYNGQNLLTSTDQALTVSFSPDNNTRLTVDGVNVLGDRNTDNRLGLFQGGGRYLVSTAGSVRATVRGVFAADRNINERFSILAGFFRTAINVGTNPLTIDDIAADASGRTGFSIFLNGAFNNVATRLRENLDLAADRIEQIESYFANNVAILQNRLSFTDEYTNTLRIGRDKIVIADVNEEAANLTALRTRSQIGIGALAANAASEQQLLRLLQQ